MDRRIFRINTVHICCWGLCRLVLHARRRGRRQGCPVYGTFPEHFTRSALSHGHDGSWVRHLERLCELFLWKLIRCGCWILCSAFIVAAVKMIKYACIYAINQIQAQSPENKLIQFLGNCLKVLVSCIERFIRFLGHVAYIETAVYGKNFCSSLLRAFKRLIRNAIRFSFVTLFSKLVIFLGSATG